MSVEQVEAGLLVLLIVVCSFLTFGLMCLMGKKMEKDILEERKIRDRMVEKYGLQAMDYGQYHPI
jgi:hypothetical protein